MHSLIHVILNAEILYSMRYSFLTRVIHSGGSIIYHMEIYVIQKRFHYLLELLSVQRLNQIHFLVFHHSILRSVKTPLSTIIFASGI